MNRDSYYAELKENANEDYGYESAEVDTQAYVDKRGNEPLELIVAKNRNGPTGSVVVNYRKITGQISDRVVVT